MATCLMCKKDVTSGYVVCGDCAESLKPSAMPPTLDLFAAWLGMEVTQSDTINFCSMCGIEKCRTRNNASVCRQGVTAWFRAKANEFLNTSISGVLGRLVTVCFFPEVFEDVEEDGTPHRKIGHIRADHDGYRWWNTVWGAHWDLATAEIKAEMDRTYEALIAENALHDLNALRRFCWSHPEAQASQKSDDEFNFYLVGKTCDFWVRLITRDKDYNMYLNAYAKAGSQEAE